MIFVKGGPRNRIEFRLVPRMAAQQAPQSKPTTFQNPVMSESVDGIGRAGGIKTASPGQYRRDEQLVATNQASDHPPRQLPECVKGKTCHCRQIPNPLIKSIQLFQGRLQIAHKGRIRSRQCILAADNDEIEPLGGVLRHHFVGDSLKSTSCPVALDRIAHLSADSKSDARNRTVGLPRGSISDLNDQARSDPFTPGSGDP